MGLRINQNIAAMNAYRNLTVTDGQMSKSLEKLSSGFRINRAADDAAGLSISEGLRAQVGGTKVAIRNAQDGISVVQTAEGALSEVHSILQRMRDLAVQASNTGSQDSDARAAAQTEYIQLQTEIDRIGNTTKFGNSSLLDGSLGSQAVATGSVQTGPVTTDATPADHTFTLSNVYDSAGATHSITVALSDSTAYTGQALVDAVNSAIDTAASGWGGGVTSTVHAELKTGLSGSFQVSLVGSKGFTVTNAASDLTGVVAATGGVALSGNGGVFQVGANNTTGGHDQITVKINDMRSSALASGALSGVSNKIASGTASAIDDIDKAIKAVSTARANLGAYQNRFEHTIANLSVTQENLSASESRIRDTDMAQEMVSFTRSQILTQAGTAMLAQANQAPQQVLQLLRG
jgi:flagellin